MATGILVKLFGGLSDLLFFRIFQTSAEAQRTELQIDLFCNTPCLSDMGYIDIISSTDKDTTLS